MTRSLFFFLLFCTAFLSQTVRADGHCWSVQLGLYQEEVHATNRLASVGDQSCRLQREAAGIRVLCGCYADAQQARQALPGWQRRFDGAFMRETAKTAPVTASPEPGPPPLPAVPALLSAPPMLAQSAVEPTPVPVTSPAAAPTKAEAESTEDRIVIYSGAARAKKLRQRPDEKLPDSEFTATLFGRPLTVGGEASLKRERRTDFALATEADDLERDSAELELELFYNTSNHGAVFLEGIVRRQQDEEPEADESDSFTEWRRGEMWVFTGGWFDDRVGYQIGRQNFIDSREWWWDANLDALRIHYDTRETHAEFGLARELAKESSEDERIDPEDDKLLRFFAVRTQKQEDENVERSLFLLYQLDQSETETAGTIVDRDLRDESDFDALWFGWRTQGRWKSKSAGRIYYWFDAGVLWGEEKLVDYDSISATQSEVDSVVQRHVRAAAFDLGVNWQTNLPGDFTLTAGYAAGSGDRNPDDSVDSNYRQTGLQDNNDKFRGVTSFKFYGELFDPELSNLSISTLGAGFRFLEGSSVDLVYHTYSQLQAVDEVRDAGLDVDPTGDSKDLGSELDLIVGIEEWERLEMELVWSRFTAGKAYGPLKGDKASLWTFEVSYRF